MILKLELSFGRKKPNEEWLT